MLLEAGPSIFHNIQVFHEHGDVQILTHVTTVTMATEFQFPSRLCKCEKNCLEVAPDSCFERKQNKWQNFSRYPKNYIKLAKNRHNNKLLRIHGGGGGRKINQIFLNFYRNKELQLTMNHSSSPGNIICTNN